MDFEQARFNMVEQQIRPWGVLDQDVLDALMHVNREYFVPEAQQALAFADIEMPIAKGQTMLTPKIEARVMQAVSLKDSDSVLEIGTGSGFMAALLAERAEWVRTLEIDRELAQLAHDNLQRNDVDNVIVEEADGMDGWPARAPYDVIVASGAVRSIPQAWRDQLKIGGRLFAFVGVAPVMQARLVTRMAENAFSEETVFETVVPALKASAKANENFTF